MKRFLAIAMMLCFVVGLAACQQSDQTKKQSNSMPNSHQQHTSKTPSNETQKKEKNSSY